MKIEIIIIDFRGKICYSGKQTAINLQNGFSADF